MVKVEKYLTYQKVRMTLYVVLYITSKEGSICTGVLYTSICTGSSSTY